MKSSSNEHMQLCYIHNLYMNGRHEPPVFKYLHDRGFVDDTIATFRLGSTSTERITFPICDEYGKIHGFQTRVPSEDYRDGKKYVNSPNTEVYNKSNYLFGLDIAKDYAPSRNHTLYIVEGNFDVMRMHQVGMQNTVGCMGSLISERQAFEICKHATNVVMVFDDDDAGLEGMCRSYLNLLRQPFSSINCIIISGDPDTFFRDGNPLPEELDMLQVYIEVQYAKRRMTSVEGKYEFIKDMVDVFKLHGNKEYCLQIIEKVLR